MTCWKTKSITSDESKSFTSDAAFLVFRHAGVFKRETNFIFFQLLETLSLTTERRKNKGTEDKGERGGGAVRGKGKK